MADRKADKKKSSEKKLKSSPSKKDPKLKKSKSKKSSEKLPSGEAKTGEPTGAHLPMDPAVAAFETNQLFTRYDINGDGKLDKDEFAQIVKNNPEILLKTKLKYDNTFPTEIVSHRLLTHFDETSGVAIPKTEVDQHKLMGNTVTTLVESYRARYDNLRALLTGRLLPKREQLLQLRRQLQSTSVEVDATRRGIERETLADTEKILERLRNVESMRQSAIKHQILQLEEELQVIERVVRRVELANVDDGTLGPTGVLLTSANPGAMPVESFRPPRASSMVELIHQYSDLCANIEKLATKPVTVQTDFPTDDFPREISERLEVIARCDRYMHTLGVKDHMLWSALQEKERLEEQLQSEKRLTQEYSEEVAGWAQMMQDMQNQFARANQEKELLEKRNAELLNVLRTHNILYVSGSS